MNQVDVPVILSAACRGSMFDEHFLVYSYLYVKPNINSFYSFVYSFASNCGLYTVACLKFVIRETNMEKVSVIVCLVSF